MKSSLKFASLLVLLATFSCAPAQVATTAPPAATPQTSAKPAKKAAAKADRYAKPPHLSPTAVNPLALIPPPPDAASLEHLEEIQLILKLQKARTQDQIAQVRRDNSLSVFNFDTVLGPKFNPADCPQTARFFDLAEADEGYFARIAKSHYQRPRPTAEPGVTPVFPQGGFSYPSGHSTRATFFAELLAHVCPERAADLLRRGQEIGFGREIAGVHYPSDVLAGRILGRALTEALLATPDARAELEALRPEIQRAIAN